MSGTTLVPVVGVVSVTGSDPVWSLTETLAVGDGAPGLLDINSGGVVIDSANMAAGTDGGDGTISVTDGGTLTNDGGTTYIGEDTGSTGTLLVSGINSALEGNSALIIGENGIGFGTITDNSTISLAGTAYLSLGHQTGGVGSLLVQDAVLDLVNNTYGIGLGKFGQGFLDVEAGGTVETSGDGTANSGGINIGESAGATGQLRVNGAGALIDEEAYLIVGYSGTGTLAVTNGGTVDIEGSAYLTVGASVGATGSVLVADGGVITFGTATSGIALGRGGSGTLDIESSGTVDVNALLADNTLAGIGIGQLSGGNGLLIVNGAGAALNDAGPLFVGYGSSGTLIVSNGGSVEIGPEINVGEDAGVTGTVLVSEGGILTLGTSTQGISIGQYGSGTLDVESGGTVQFDGTVGVALGQYQGGTGLVVVDGTDSLLNVGSTTGGIAVGRGGSATVEVTNGGTLRVGGTSGLGIGDSADSTGLVIVDGINSLLNLGSTTSGIAVGEAGSATIEVTNGGTVRLNGTSGIGMGYSAGSTGLIVVDGTNSLLNLGSTAAGISVGEVGSATIEVTNNGTLRVDGATGIGLAYSPDATGLVAVNQGGVLIEDNPSATGMGIGQLGSGTLLIESGGTVKLEGTTGSSAIGLGNTAGSSGLVIVSGSGSLLDLETPQSGPQVGKFGSGTMEILSGGTFLLNDPISGGIGIGVSAGSSGTLSVSGAGALLQATGTILGTGMTVGNAGTGVLSVTDGAELNLGGELKLTSSSTGTGSAIVDDATIDAGWLADGGGGVGTLTIQDNAQVNLAGLQTSNVGEATTGSGTLLVNGGTLTETAGNFDVGVNGVGLVEISAGGTVSVSTLTVGSAGLISNALGDLSALNILVAQGGLITGTGLLDSPNIDDAGVIAAAAGVLSILGVVSGNGTLAIDQHSAVDVFDGVGSGTTIDFAGAGGTLIVSQPSLILGTLTSFSAGDTLEFTGLSANQAVYDPTTQTVDFYDMPGGQPIGTIAVAGTYNPTDFVVTSDANKDTFVTVLCFCKGTLIQTSTGQTPVEHLVPGDIVTTHAGAHRPIAWIGKGRVLATRGRRTAATPVIIRNSAFAENVPHKDLRVTKGHAFHFDGALIPIEFLVNHRSILWDDQAQEVELYHIELETHDVLLANGAAAESYRDDGNRWLFQNANTGWDQPPKAPCAPVLTGGPLVDATWRYLLDRSGHRPSLPLTNDPDLHLVADGQRLDPINRRSGLVAFRLPKPPASLHIASRSAVPQELGIARDARPLGVALRRLVLSQAMRHRTIEAGDPRLADGFHVFEADSQIRWTDGDAVLPQSLFDGLAGPWLLTLHLDGTTQYRDEAMRRQVA